MQYLSTEDPLAVAAVKAIHSGDVAALKQLLADHPELASASYGSAQRCKRPGRLAIPSRRKVDG